MADLGMSTQQWPHTCNANLAFKSVVNTFNQKELQEVFLETPTFATEKLDGTNVAKDDTGQIYSRRLKVGADKTHYQKTSLSQVREADIRRFRELLCSAGDIEGTAVSLCVVYGELICNPEYYQYKHRGLAGQWRVFGVCLTTLPSFQDQVITALTDNHFATVKLREQKIQILPCLALFKVAESSGLQVVPVIASDKSIAQVVEDKKAMMKRGDLEGIVFTTFTKKFRSGYNIVKWKGAHEPQPNGLEIACQTKNKVEEESDNEELKKMFESLKDVLEDTSDNVHMALSTGSIKREPKTSRKEKKDPGSNLSATDRKIIMDGCFHSMKKFDSVDNYDEETYISLLRGEVRRHFVEEKNIQDNFSEDDDVIKFIKASVGKAIKGKVEK